MTTRQRVFVIICLVITVASLGLSLTASAVHQPQEPTPTKVATLDINRVREGLSERVDAQAGLMARTQDIEAENNERIRKIEEIQAELADVVDPAERETLEEELDLHLVHLH